MASEDCVCVCGLQTGRICPVHPDRPVEFRTINGPPLPPDAVVPWTDDKAAFVDHDVQIHDRTMDLASKAAQKGEG